MAHGGLTVSRANRLGQTQNKGTEEKMVKTPLCRTANNKNKNYIREDIKMRNYQELEFKLIVLENEDVLTSSADFQDASTGDNGVWFPGSTGGNSQWQNN